MRETHLHPVTTAVAGQPADQVKRRLAFEREHPDWRIIWDPDYRVWRAWRLLEGGEHNLTRYELRWLLDDLEALEAKS